MTLTQGQISELLEQFSQQLIIFAAKTSGTAYLSSAERHVLESSGINVDSLYEESSDVVKLNFQLGLLSQAIGQSAESITFQQLKKYIQSGQQFPLTERELTTIDSIKRQAIADIRTNQGKIFSDINNVVKQNDAGHRSQHEFIRETIIEGVSKRQTVKEISTELARLTGDWSRNFNKSVQYISHTALNEGRLALIQRREQGTSQVYFHVQKDACKHCVSLYLTHGPGSEPRIFTASELLTNGSNIGRKTSDWMATVEPVHVHCRCLLTEYIEDTKWNGHAFVIPRDQIYVSPIKRKKIRVVFNGEEFFV